MLETKMNKVLEATDEVMSNMFKATGTNILDAIGGMNDGEATMAIAGCKLYVASKNLALEMVDMMDTQKEQMEELLDLSKTLIRKNNELLEQVKNLQKVENKERSVTERVAE